MVLTDYCMPEMTGYDLLKAIKVLLLLLLLQDQSVDAAFLNVFASFLHFCMCLSLTRCKLLLNFAGTEPSEADPGHRHVVRRRAPEDQPVRQAT